MLHAHTSDGLDEIGLTDDEFARRHHAGTAADAAMRISDLDAADAACRRRARTAQLADA